MSKTTSNINWGAIGSGRINRDNSPLSERIATTVVTLQSEVDDSPRSFRVTSLATEHRGVKVAVITVFLVTERILVVFVREAKAL